MHRLLAAFLLLCACGCGDLTRIPPPPVPLSALDGRQASAAGSEGATAALPQVRLVRALPPQALVALHLPDIRGAIAGFKRTALFTMLSGPEMAKLFGKGFSITGPKLGAGGPGGASAARLLEALQAELVVSIERFRIEPGRPVPDMRVLLGATVRGAEDEARQLIGMASMAAGAQKSVRVEKGVTAGVGFTRFVGTQPFPWVAELAVYHDALLAGFGRDTVTGALERLADESKPSLAENVSFRAGMKHCADPRDALRMYVDLQLAMREYGRYLPEHVRTLVADLGLDRIRALAGTIRFDAGSIVLSGLLDSPGGKDLLTDLLAGHPVDRQFLGRIPADARSFSLFALDGGRILARLRKVLPKDQRARLAIALAGLKAKGIDVESDIFDLFGPRYALATLPYGPHTAKGLAAVWNQLLGTALVVEVQDPKQAGRVLALLPEGDSTVARRAYMVEGVPATSYRFTNGRLPPTFAPAYALSGSYLVVAPCEETLRRMLRPRSPETERRFRKLLRDVPVEAATLSYEDLRDGTGLQRNVLLSGFLAGLRTSLPGGAMQLPDPATMKLDLGETVSYSVADESGVFFSSRSPTGGFGSFGGVTGLAAAAAVAVPNLHAARVQSNEVTALVMLRAIHVAEETFRANSIRDDDEDGEGEYGFLVDLLGRQRPGEQRVLSGSRLLHGDFQSHRGDWVHAGYYYRAYLPSEDGSPVGEEEGAARLREVDGDLSEGVVVVVAWPLDRGSTGKRAFLLAPDGTIYACADGSYGGRKAPAPDTLFSQRGNLASEPLRPGTATRDGCTWRAVTER